MTQNPSPKAHGKNLNGNSQNTETTDRTETTRIG